MKPSLMKALLCVVIFSLILPACGSQATETPVVTETQTAPAPQPTPTVAPRSLTICLGEEPNTLYPYGNLNSAARSVLSAIYDGPMDAVNYTYEPIILEKVPNLEDGDAALSEVTVKAGDQVVDSSGKSCNA